MTSRNNQTPHLPAYLFIMFWLAQAISLFGDRLNNFSLLALINEFSPDPALTLSKIYLFMFLPIYTLSPLIGAVLDRLNKRWVLVITDIFRGAIVFLIPPLFIRSGSFAPIMGIVFLSTTGNLFFLPAKSSLIPELVDRERLVRVNSLLWAAGIAGVIGGFLGGGLIYDYVSWESCFYIDGATYILSAALLLGIALHRGPARHTEVHDVEHPTIVSSIVTGVRAIRHTRGIMRFLGIQMLIFFGAGGFSVLALELINEVSPPGSSLGISVAGLAVGLGMGIGSLLVNKVPEGSYRRAEIVFIFLFAPAAVLLAAEKSLVTIGIGALAGGFCAAPLVILSEAELQKNTPQELRGRVFSFREILTRTCFLASAFIFSAAGRHADNGTLIILLGLVLASTGIIWMRAMDRRDKHL